MHASIVDCMLETNDTKIKIKIIDNKIPRTERTIPEVLQRFLFLFLCINPKTKPIIPKRTAGAIVIEKAMLKMPNITEATPQLLSPESPSLFIPITGHWVL